MAYGGYASPARKRQRLSSPDYTMDDDLDEDVLIELNRIETMSQLVKRSEEEDERAKPSRRMDPEAKQRRLLAIELALSQDGNMKSVGKIMTGLKHSRQEEEEEPLFEDPIVHPDRASTSPRSASAPTSEKPDHELTSSQEDRPQEEDYSKWFESGSHSEAQFVGFQRASQAIMPAPTTDGQAEHGVGFVSAIAGFSTASKIGKAVLEPSKEALAFASKKLTAWSKEIDSALQEADIVDSPTKLPATPVRPVLATITNTPSFSSPLIDRPAMGKKRTFKPPSFVGKSSGMTANVSTPEQPRTLPPNSASGFSTPLPSGKILALGSSGRAHKTTFKTPFKKGMAPGDPGRAELNAQLARKATETPAQNLCKQKTKSSKPSRIGLKASGVRPQQNTAELLEASGINVHELEKITIENAPYYMFTTASDEPSSQTARVALGPKEALAHLHRTGRKKGVTQKWVDNQWALILWKLAGLVCLEPTRNSPFAYTWCWNSVLSQLEKHYDYELHDGHRPALRRITTGDSPAGAPMVLVVTKVLWTEQSRKPLPERVVGEVAGEIELSDGWYRLKAAVDAPIAWAIQRGVIRPGRKLALAGASLENTKKDPMEILEAYNSCTLELSGNATHLAAWHTKLGFQPGPFVATLNSLTPDGGHVPFMHLVVEKVYGMGYLEYTQEQGSSGKRVALGPRNEVDESAEHDKWQKRRDIEEQKLREELGARWARWEGFAERLEQRVGKYNPEEDKLQPKDVEDLFDNLDEQPPNQVSSYLAQLSSAECYWLAQYFRQRVDRDKETAADEIDLELNKDCPPRDVKSLRIIMVRDAQTQRRPANRIAQLTIWDVLTLCVAEGAKPGNISVGQRFYVTNLQPRQYGAWMGKDKDDVVYLSTRRESRFVWLK